MIDLLNVFLRAIILYGVIIFSVRLMGKRQIGELQPSELVITILMSNIATLPIEDMSIPMIMGIVPIFTLVCIDVILSHLSLKYRTLRRLISGSPKIIIYDGKVDQKTLGDLRFSTDDLLAALREQQIFDVNEVQLAVVETTGKISVYQKETYQPITFDKINMSVQTGDPPQLIVDNGNILYKSLEFIGRDKNWLEKTMKKEKVSNDDIFLMTADKNGKYTIIRKENDR